MTADSHPAESDPIAWDVAEQVAGQILRTSPPLDARTQRALDDDLSRATSRAELLVQQATGLPVSAAPARALVTGRMGWVEANVGSFRRLMQPLSARLAEHPSWLRQTMNPATRSIAGVEVGLMLSWMSGRVLGQYDLLAIDGDDTGDALYFVGPNIVGLERRHGFPASEFRLWIAIHELTHRAQFTGVPWLREYFLGLVEQGFALANPDPRSALDALSRALKDVRAGRNPLAEGGIVSMMATPDQLAVFRDAQALMSLLEGHGDVVMSRAGASEIPGAKRFAKVLAERRQSAKGLAKLIQQALGIDAKFRQYAEGEHFVEEVERIGGADLFSRVWEGPEALPKLDEIRAPERWIARVNGVAPVPA